MRLLTGGGKLQKDERKEYMDLCNQMTSRKPDITIEPENGVDYKSIADKMIEILLSHTIVEINSLDEGEKKEQMLNDFKIISANKEKFDDANHIGRVNIFSLQVIILFTLNDVDYDPNFEKYDVVGSVVIDFQTLIEIDWKNYGAVRDLLTTPNNPISRLTVLYNKDGDDFIYLITLIDLFTLDELNIAFLDKNILCGISYTSLIADGRNMNPYMFLDHDILHGQNYKYVCFQRLRLDLENVTKFYNYCRTYYRGEKKKWYSIQVMIFLLIHESAFCNFFFERKPTKLIDELLNKFIENYFNDELLNIERFTRPNDLDFVLSNELKERLKKHRLEKHRRGEEEAKERGDLEKDVKKYLKEVIIADYLNALDSWYDSTHSGGSKYKRKNRRTKRVSKRKRKNKKRSRRIYTLKI